ncbi:MAG: glycosyltransferase family A protein [Candidatus Methanomethyliaceae archaeon]
MTVRSGKMHSDGISVDELLGRDDISGWGAPGPERPIHSLLIPTRNRPDLIHVPVGFYLRSSRDDVEVVVADGSDDPEPVRERLRAWLCDRRLVLLDHSPGRLGKVQSMRENWSRGLLECRGRWITVIGDDDVCDPALAYFLETIERRLPEAQAVAWQAIKFRHGLPEPEVPAQIPLGYDTMVINSRGHLERQMTWPVDNKLPEFGASLYHGALRRELLAHIRTERNGSFFRFAAIDWDMAWTATHFTPAFIAAKRPYSIMGHSEKSNSASVRRLDARRRAFEQWLSEDARFDGISLELFESKGVDKMFAMFLPVMILGFRNAFAHAYGYAHIPLNKQNFLQTCILYCLCQDDEESFEWCCEQLVIFARAFMGVEIPKERLVRPGAPEHMFYGYNDEKLFFDRSLVDYDLQKFSNLVFRLIPHWTFSFRPLGSGE